VIRLLRQKARDDANGRAVSKLEIPQRKFSRIFRHNDTPWSNASMMAETVH
jgi:hypothetical protein